MITCQSIVIDIKDLKQLLNSHPPSMFMAFLTLCMFLFFNLYIPLIFVVSPVNHLPHRAAQSVRSEANFFSFQSHIKQTLMEQKLNDKAIRRTVGKFEQSVIKPYLDPPFTVSVAVKSPWIVR